MFKNWLARGTVLGLFVACTIPLAIAATGCNPECIDSFDCRNKGANYFCESSKCVREAPVMDAGSLTDAGAQSTDAGMTDAGEMTDAGATEMDAGTDAGI